MITNTTADLLTNEGFSNIFVVDAPADIDDYILISNSGGFGVGVEDAGFSRPTIQILLADKSKSALDNRVVAIRKFLYNITDREIIDSLYTLATWDDLLTWDGWTYWDAYIDAEGTLINENINTYELVQGYDISSDILDLQLDEQRRYLVSINFTVFTNI